MTEANVRQNSVRPMSFVGVVLRLVIAWTWVGVPLCWGVYRTYLTSIPLFHKREIKQPEQTSDRASFRGSRNSESGSDGLRLDA
jgi:hypothetical protein